LRAQIALNCRSTCRTDSITNGYSNNSSHNDAVHFAQPQSERRPDETSGDDAGIREPVLFFLDDHIALYPTKRQRCKTPTMRFAKLSRSDSTLMM